MKEQERNAYILGTETAELHRLGLQHQVWASEAIKGWELAGFTAGHTLLDLGCGPGFCTTELAYITGEDGKVIGIDKSELYINFLNRVVQQFSLNIETQCTDFDTMQLHTNSLDGVYSRWAFAWIPNPQEIIAKLYKALKKVELWLHKNILIGLPYRQNRICRLWRKVLLQLYKVFEIRMVPLILVEIYRYISSKTALKLLVHVR